MAYLIRPGFVDVRTGGPAYGDEAKL